MRLLDEIHFARPFYGSRRLRDELETQGHPVNRKRVQRLVRQMGLRALYPKPRTSQPGVGHTVYPYLLRGLSIERPNQVWATDIRGGPRNLDRLLRWDPDQGEGVWNATEETELSG